jgi:RNA polymerase sigma-70 factor (ECF subfamily)
MTDNQQQKIFQEWLDKYRALLFKIINAYAFSPEDQDDLFQEVCLQIYRSIPNFKAKSAISTWLYRIALNTAIKWSAREKKHGNNHQEMEKLSHLLERSTESNDSQVLWLYSEIKKLNEIDRSLILLFLDGCSYKTMSEILGISESNIGTKIHRIKKQFINKAKEYEYDRF